ncbi:helix-turn-helix domain-containing protein [Patescibacteria group bacterium]|nr:helix-turn-helix domain-containing protein [Patescibacteria group bacterium]
MNEHEDVVETLKNLMKSKGIGPQRLSSMTDVPKRFIDALLQGDFKNLPARPYIRGYLFKISNTLGVENDSLWDIYRSSVETPSSGEKDKLPINRFAIKKIDSGKIIAILSVILVVAFFAINLNRIIGRPTIDMALPESTDQKILQVEGFIKPGDQLTLNGELIYTDEEGGFVKDVQMELGLNTLEFKIHRYLGREATVLKQVFYQPSGE